MIKRFIVLFFLCISIPAYGLPEDFLADHPEPQLSKGSQNSVFVYGGAAFSRGCTNCSGGGAEYLVFGYRHYFQGGPWVTAEKKYADSGWFVQGLVIDFNDGNMGSGHGGTYLGATAGYRTKGDKFPRVLNKWFIEGGLGLGYLNNPDGDHPDGKGLLSRSGQFNIFYGAGYRITENANIVFGGGHLSNGKQAFNRGRSYAPNHGRDFGYIGAEFKVDWFK